MKVLGKRLAPIAAAGFALVLIGAGALASHSWNQEASLNPVYVILALIVIALAFPSTRQWAREATNVKLPGGFEITRQVEDAVAEAAALPDAGESSESDSKRKLKFLQKDWSGEPKSAIGLLQGVLRDRLDWIEREFYEDKRQTDSKTLDKLREDDLIGPGQARLLGALSEATGVAIEREFAKGGKAKESAVRFMEEADRTVSRVRLIALDNKLRKDLQREGLRVVDIGGQPSDRWPDFYVFDPEAKELPPLRIAPGVALQEKSKVLENVWSHLRETQETPLDVEAQRVIVVPRISATKLEEYPDIPARRRDGFMAWIVERRVAPEKLNDSAN
ncbi:MAG: DoxX family protein [Actinomycetota bacterium]|nr:DoxX family protein [Actinomycetota bacterium]